VGVPSGVFSILALYLGVPNFPELIRAIWRREEILQQLIVASKSIGETKLEAKLEEAVSKIKRHIIFSASLYL